MMTDLHWADPADTALMTQLADFFTAEIISDASYISHGEVQGGLSDDGKTWHPDLAARMREDLLDMGPDRQILFSRKGEDVSAAAIILWVDSGRSRFGVIEDMAVASNLRSTGLGRALMDKIEAAAREKGMQWLFLESGLGNERAHAFFERSGFSVISKVFSKPL